MFWMCLYNVPEARSMSCLIGRARPLTALWMALKCRRILVEGLAIKTFNS